MSVNALGESVSNIIANTILAKLGCATLNNTITQAQLLDVNCTPPASWGSVVYNGEACQNAIKKYGLGDPRICPFCYACCANNVNQGNFVTITPSCGISASLLSDIQRTLKLQLSGLTPYSGAPTSLTTLVNNLTLQGITQAITNIKAVQSVNIRGVGIQNNISQTMVLNLILNSIRTPQFIAALNQYVADVSQSSPTSNAKQPATLLTPSSLNLRMGTLPATTSQDHIVNIFTNAIIDAFKTTSACVQVIPATQTMSIDCSSLTNDQILKYATSNACTQALVNNLPNPEIYCSPCSNSNATQNIILTFTANCSLASVASLASSTVLNYFTTPGNVLIPAPQSFALPQAMNAFTSAIPASQSNNVTIPPVAVQDPNYIQAIQQLSAGINTDLVTTIFQGIQLYQSIKIHPDGDPKSATYKVGIFQNSINDLVANAILQNYQILSPLQNAATAALDAVTKQPTATVASKGTSTGTPLTPQKNNTSSSYLMIFLVFVIICAVAYYMRKRVNQFPRIS
jgi:hypothetical protein